MTLCAPPTNSADYQADLLGGFQVDNELKLGRLLDGNVEWFRSFEDLVDHHRRSLVAFGVVRTVGHQTILCHTFIPSINRG